MRLSPTATLRLVDRRPCSGQWGVSPDSIDALRHLCAPRVWFVGGGEKLSRPYRRRVFWRSSLLPSAILLNTPRSTLKATRWSQRSHTARVRELPGKRELLEWTSKFVNANVSRFSGVLKFHELRQNASVSLK